MIIRGAAVYDGLGSPPTRDDVLIVDGMIAEIAPKIRPTTRATVLDAGGLALAPGFIDSHSHGDFTLPSFPGATNSLTQGVTTEVVGQCGFSPAPVSPRSDFAAELQEMCHGLGPNLEWSWTTFAAYLEALSRAHPAVNCIPLVGHGAIRVAVMGAEDRAPWSHELRAMQRHLGEALAAGAWGMSTGLVYLPGSYASEEEICAIGAELTATRRLYASHVRNEAEGLLDALDEAMAVGRRLRVPVQISHLKSAGQPNRGLVARAIQNIEAARGLGQEIHCDAYPYTSGSTFLRQVVPPWAHEGGVESLLGRLEVREVRNRIRRDIEVGLPGWFNIVGVAGGWARIAVASVANGRYLRNEGRTLAELAVLADADPLEVALDLLIADKGATTIIVDMMDEADVDAAISYAQVAIGSDQLGVVSEDARVHPRAYGAFTRVLGTYVRERGLLLFEEAIRKMTSLPASILGLGNRGRIVTGAVADLVLFDPVRVTDRSTYAVPTLPSAGIETVLLAGRFAVRDARIVATDLGEVLRYDRAIVSGTKA